MYCKQIPSVPELFTYGYRFKDGDLFRFDGSIVKKSKAKSGHQIWQLTINGKADGVLVHRFICQMANGDPPGKDYEVNHKDGNPGNNHPSNLEWVTHSGNQRHSRRVLGKEIGSAHHNSKLTGLDIRPILWAASSGVRTKDIAMAYGVSPNTICDIVSGRTWGHWFL